MFLTLRRPHGTTVTMITPRRASRDRLNAQAVKKHSVESGNQMYIVQAQDTIDSGNAPSMAQRVTITGRKSDTTGQLEDVVILSIGMKAMVTFNIVTDADLANRTWG